MADSGMTRAETVASNPMAAISEVAACMEAGRPLPDGWHVDTREYPTAPGFTAPAGMVAVSDAYEHDGHVVQCFAPPGSHVFADFGELDLGLVRAADEAEADLLARWERVQEVSRLSAGILFIPESVGFTVVEDEPA